MAQRERPDYGGRSASLGPVHHDGPCGRRVACWRPACRAEFGPYLTVEVLRRSLIAWCHGGVYVSSDLATR